MALLTLPDGDKLYYEIHGSGPPLLLISGLTGLASFWSMHIDALSKRFTVVTHDHRGCGQSAKPRFDYSVEQMAEDVVALMDGLGLERAHVVGHSTGGAIGQVLAIDHSSRLDRLVIAASWAGPDPYFDLLFEMRSKVLATFGPAEYLRQAALIMRTPAWLMQHPQEAAMPDDATVRMLVADVDCTLRRIAAIRRFDRRRDLHRVTTPTLISAAAWDMVTPVHLSKELSERIPSAILDIIPEAGHFYPVTHANQFRATVLSFIAAR